jgi:Myb-like DNA-binding domain
LDIIERALSRVRAKDGAFGGTPRPDLTAGFRVAKTGNRLVRQKACETVRRQYAMTFETGLGKAMTGAARRQSNWTPEEDRRLLEFVEAGKSWVLISANLKRSLKSVQDRAQQLEAKDAKAK